MFRKNKMNPDLDFYFHAMNVYAYLYKIYSSIWLYSQQFD